MAAPTDRVQVIKQESAALGGDAADEDPFLNFPIEPQEDGIECAGVFIQDGSNRDETTYISRNGNDLLFKDINNAELTLTDLVAGAGGVTNVGADIDFLLENDPPEPDCDYTITRSAGVVTKEEWTRTGGNLLKSVDYTRAAGQVDVIVTKVFATNGTTIEGQTTIDFTRSGGQVVSATKVRDV